jgi:hypothetical protein
MCAQRASFEHHGRRILFDLGMRNRFQITPEWVRENKMENVVSDL